MKGKFITFEGAEGSGKSTHIKLLSRYLKNKGYPVVLLREPGSTHIGEQIRKMLLDKKNIEMAVAVEMLLCMAARAQVLKEKIIPALKKGKIVICDRFLDSTIAYQGYGGGLSVSFIKEMGKIITMGITPDLTILLDLEAKEGLRRAGRTKDRMEEKSFFFHRKVRLGYSKLAGENPRRIKVVEVDDRKSKTQDKIQIIVEKLLCRFKI
ncbi:MAG: dTMP kinase [Candidatus Omnitrophota bacterium]